MIGQVKITHKENGVNAYDVSVNGNTIEPIECLDFHVDPSQVPEVNMTLIGNFEYDGLANIGISFHPESTEECIRGLRFAILTDDALRDGFLASIRSALDEAGNYENNAQLAERVLNRVLG